MQWEKFAEGRCWVGKDIEKNEIVIKKLLITSIWIYFYCSVSEFIIVN